MLLLREFKKIKQMQSLVYPRNSPCHPQQSQVQGSVQRHPVDWLTFRQQRCICTSMIRKGKSYYQSALTACNSFSKVSIPPTNSKTTDRPSMVQAFNQIFLFSVSLHIQE